MNVEEPAFIKRFREQSGMRPEATIESKLRRDVDADKDDLRDREDEAPQVVVGAGVSEEEANDFVQQNLINKHHHHKDESDEEKPTEGELEAEKSGEISFFVINRSLPPHCRQNSLP